MPECQNARLPDCQTPTHTQASHTAGRQVVEKRLKGLVLVLGGKEDAASSGKILHLPAKLERAKLLAANAHAAYMGYDSTKNVKTPENTSTVLISPTVSRMMHFYIKTLVNAGNNIPHHFPSLHLSDRCSGNQRIE